MISWLLASTPGDPKHSGIGHPALTVSIICLSALTTAQLGHEIVLSYFFTVQDKHMYGLLNETQNQNGALVGLLLLVYLCVMLASRAMTMGALGRYDGAWACNIALFLGSYALFSRQRGLLTTAAFSVAIDQMLWYGDLISYAISRKFSVGVAKYLFWPDTTLVKKITSGHHVWFIPLTICMCAPCHLFMHFAWFFPSVLVTWVIAVLSRLLTPYEIEVSENAEDTTAVAESPVSMLRWRGQAMTASQRIHESAAGPSKKFYLNCNLCYACWKDVKWGSAVLNRYDHHPYYLPYYATLWNIGNFLCFGPVCFICLVLRYLLFRFSNI